MACTGHGRGPGTGNKHPLKSGLAVGLELLNFYWQPFCFLFLVQIRTTLTVAQFKCFNPKTKCLIVAGAVDEAR